VSGEPISLLVGVGLITLLVGFVLLPIVQVVTFPSWDDYLHLTQNGRWVRAAGNTFRMVVLSTISATLVGFLYAYALARLNLRAGGVFRLIAILPLFSPPFTL
jgi:iron(III) transport system permease protein